MKQRPHHTSKKYGTMGAFGGSKKSQIEKDAIKYKRLAAKVKPVQNEVVPIEISGRSNG